MELLLKDPRVDPSSRDSQALYSASHNGHSATLLLLLSDPRGDPSLEGNSLLVTAILSDLNEVTRALVAHPKVLI